MIPKFFKIMDGLYRGGKPSISDIIDLKNKFNINKIISLDKVCGEEIENICRDLKIEHKIIHLDGSKSSIVNLFSHNLKDLLFNNGPVFFHCRHGKDRTGMLAAIVRCKFMNYTANETIDEAKSFGFGVGVNPYFLKMYENIIRCSENTDTNNAEDIVNNVRDNIDMNGSFVDDTNINSFSVPSPRPEYNEYLEQDNTRDNYNNSINTHTDEHGLPISGYHESTQDIAGAGLILNSQKFTMIKSAYILNMSYEVSDMERQVANKAIVCFDQSVKELYKASSYLDLIADPFTENPNISAEDLHAIRAKLREYRDNIIIKFNNFKRASIECLKLMEFFSSDTQLIRLIKVYISSIDELEEDVNNLSKIFADLDDSDFVNKIVENVDKIKNDCDSIDSIIYERIIKYIKTNILAANWVDSVDSETKTLTNVKEPLLLKMHNKKQSS